ASAPAQAAADATTNPAGPSETPALRGDDHAPKAALAGAGGADHIMTMSPAVRRAVLELHVDPTRIKGTGKDGRLTKDDVVAAAEAQKSRPAQAGAQARSSFVTPAKAGPAPEEKLDSRLG